MKYIKFHIVRLIFSIGVISVLFCNIVLMRVYAKPSSDVLPEGIRSVVLAYGYPTLGVDSTFNAEGRLQSLVHDLNKSLSLSQFAQIKPEIKKLQEAVDSYRSGASHELLIVNLYADLVMTESRFVFGFGWGLTDQLTLTTMLPMIARKGRSQFDVRLTNNAQSLADEMGNIPGIKEGLMEFAQTDLGQKRMIQEIFLKNGYEAPPDQFSSGGLGDIEFEARYRTIKGPNFSHVVRSAVIMPTATHEVNIRNLYDRPIGEGSIGFRLSTFQDYRFHENYTFQSMAALTTRAPSKQIRAVAKDSKQQLPNLNDPEQIEKVRKQAGTQFDTDIALQSEWFDKTFKMAAGYLFTIKGRDYYTGERNLDYARLSRNSDSASHRFEIFFEYSTIPLFQKKKFSVPFKLIANYVFPFAGKNLIYSPYGSVQCHMYF